MNQLIASFISILSVIVFYTHPVFAGQTDLFSEHVKYFYDFGLIDNSNNKTFSEVTSEIKEKYIEDWGENFVAEGMLDDFSTLKYGSKKIWSRDAEADVLKGNNVYVGTLKEWSDISGNVFLPKHIVETWKTEQGPIEISFELNNKNHVITPKYLNDYIDINILKK